MATDPKQIYADTVSHLSAKERLQLAALILDDLAATDFGDSWSDEDLRDLTKLSLSGAPTYEQENDAS